MPALNFADALNVQTEDVKKPPLAPIGHYRFKIKGYTYGEMASDKGEWDTLTFQCTPISAGDDVDQEALNKAGGLNSATVRNQFMFDKGTDDEAKAKFDRTMYNLKRFLTEHCGIDGTGKTLRQLVDASKGCEFLGSTKHRPDKNDPENFFFELDRTAPPS